MAYEWDQRGPLAYTWDYNEGSKRTSDIHMGLY